MVSQPGQENNVFMFIASWGILIVILTLFNRTRLGHVIIYYSLLLMILFVLVIEYRQLTPYLAALQTPGQLDAKLNG